MRNIQNTNKDIKKMLEIIGVSSFDDLLKAFIPDKLRFKKGEDEGDSIHIRQWDTHMTGNSQERALLWRRYKHYMPDTTSEKIDEFLDGGEKELNTIARLSKNQKI